MHILLSNDDGINAPGIQCLFAHLNQCDWVSKVTLVAPDRNRSGASNSLTLDTPLRVQQTAEHQYCVNGTPTDAVHLALTGFLTEQPDLVISGINDMANLGDDTIYSGTVAAAMEGRFLGLPAIAVSLLGAHEPDDHFDTAAKVVLALVKRLPQLPAMNDGLLNVNVPNVPWHALKGTQMTRLGYRHRAERIERMLDPRQKPIYWIGAAGAEADAGEGTDFYAVKQGYVSITPLKVDLTHHALIESLKADLCFSFATHID